MASPADREVEAREDVERIAAALYRAEEELARNPVLPFRLVPESRRNRYRAVVRRLLLLDVVRVGRRPDSGPEPLQGQEELPIPDRSLFSRTEEG